MKMSVKQLIVLHFLISILALISKFFLILWVLYALLSFFQNYTFNEEVNNIIILSYIVGLEVACRMVKTSPWVPYELGKYLLILYPLFRSRIVNEIMGYLVFLVPGIVIGFYNGVWILHMVHDTFAWIGILFFGKHLSKHLFLKDKIVKLLLMILLGCFCALCIAFFKSPNLEEIEFSYDANSQGAGGYAPNQVSTVFGLGIAICAFLFFTEFKVIGNSMLFSFFVLFLFRGILTFSRGGLVVGLLTGVMLFILRSLTRGIRFKHFTVILISSVVLILSVQLINRVSNGMLLKRLQGKTFGTELGIKEANFNTLTSDRWSIVEEDITIFQNFPFFGVGVHQSARIRAKNHPDGIQVASHVELSRLLAEHGILGLILFMSLFRIFRNSLMLYQDYYQRAFYLLAFIIGIGTTFHSATRTFVTPLFGSFLFLKFKKK